MDKKGSVFIVTLSYYFRVTSVRRFIKKRNTSKLIIPYSCPTGTARRGQLIMKEPFFEKRAALSLSQSVNR